VADATSTNGEPSYTAPMFIVGGFMLLSAVLMLALSSRNKKALTPELVLSK